MRLVPLPANPAIVGTYFTALALTVLRSYIRDGELFRGNASGRVGL